MIRKFFAITFKASCSAPKVPRIHWHYRRCSQALLPRLINTSTSSLDFDISEEFTEPFRKNLFKAERVNRLTLIHKFKHIFNCNDEHAKRILDTNKSIIKMPMSKLNNNIDLLFLKKITNKCILENSFLLCTNPKYLKLKIEIMERMEARNMDDFVPLLRNSPKCLAACQLSMKKEKNHVPEGNRIYFFSQILNVPPTEVSKYFSTHMFMFDVGFDMIVENLKILQEYEVASMNILRDLWAFKYLPKSVRARLDRAKKAQKEKIMPWMVRCPETVLAKSLQLSLDSRTLLGEQTVLEYLSERLGYDVDITKHIALKHESVLKVRVTKIKEVLDYLLEEEKYDSSDIARVPRILSHSLETTKRRLNELKSVGCRPSTLVIVCRSQNEYNKFLENWITIRNLKKL